VLSHPRLSSWESADSATPDQHPPGLLRKEKQRGSQSAGSAFLARSWLTETFSRWLRPIGLAFAAAHVSVQNSNRPRATSVRASRNVLCLTIRTERRAQMLTATDNPMFVISLDIDP